VAPNAKAGIDVRSRNDIGSEGLSSLPGYCSERAAVKTEQYDRTAIVHKLQRLGTVEVLPNRRSGSCPLAVGVLHWCHKSLRRGGLQQEIL
jgi:hypothetical protein